MTNQTTQNTRHKHYDVIVAAAEGKTIQHRESDRFDWQEYIGKEALSCLSWFYEYQYRVKPEMVDMWQFAYKEKDHSSDITGKFYKSEDEFRTFCDTAKFEWIVKLEPTKIVREV